MWVRMLECLILAMLAAPNLVVESQMKPGEVGPVMGM